MPNVRHMTPTTLQMYTLLVADLWNQCVIRPGQTEVRTHAPRHRLKRCRRRLQKNTDFYCAFVLALASFLTFGKVNPGPLRLTFFWGREGSLPTPPHFCQRRAPSDIVTRTRGREGGSAEGCPAEGVRFLPHIEFWPFLGPSLALTFHNVKNHGGGGAEGEPGGIARNEEQKKTKETTQRGKPRQTELKQQRKTLRNGTNKKVSVFVKTPKAGGVFTKRRLVAVKVLRCLGVKVFGC